MSAFQLNFELKTQNEQFNFKNNSNLRPAGSASIQQPFPADGDFQEKEKSIPLNFYVVPESPPPYNVSLY